MLGPKSCKGAADVAFACLVNLHRKKKFLHSKGGRGVLLMIEDVSLLPSAEPQRLLELVRQIEVSGQFFDPCSREMLRVRDVRHVLTSHDVGRDLGRLAPRVTTLSVEPKGPDHLASLFEATFGNFLSSLPKADPLSDSKFVKSFSKVVRGMLTAPAPPGRPQMQSSPAQRLLELERSLWQVDKKNFITRTGLVGVFHCEFQRLFGLGLGSEERQREFRELLPKLLQRNLSNSLPLTELRLGVVSRLHIPGTTCFVSSRDEHIKKLIECIDDVPRFLRVTLNGHLMNSVLELNRFLDSPQPLWLSGPSFSGKKTALRLACFLSGIELVDLGVRYVDQENLSLRLADLLQETSLDKAPRSEPCGPEGSKKWMRLSQNPGAVFSGIENPLASLSRAENCFAGAAEGLAINPLLEMLKETLLRCFAQVLLQKKRFVLLVSQDLFNFRDQAMVNEVVSALESLATPFEVISCFRKQELQKMFVEGAKRDKQGPQDPGFRDWFR